MILLSIVLSFVAFMHLAMVLKPHYKSICKGKISKVENTCFHVLGWSLLALSLYPCLLHWNVGFAVTAWLGLLTLSSFVVVALLAYFEMGFLYLWRFFCPGAWLAMLAVKLSRGA